MVVLALSADSFIMKVVAVLFVICCVTLILIILIQKGKGGGLSAAFAGGMASGLLGSKTGDFLTWVTIVLVVIFLTLAGLMAKFYRPPGLGDFGPGPTVPQKQPVEPEPTGGGASVEPPVDAGKALTGDANDIADMNLPDG
jgi:preprotein translocase subunit SecG